MPTPNAWSSSCQTRSKNTSTLAKTDDRHNHHRRAPKQLLPRRPRDLAHLGLDGDQKIGESRHVDQRESSTTDRPHRQCRGTPKSGQRECRHRCRSRQAPKTTTIARAANVNCRVIRPWLRLYKPIWNMSRQNPFNETSFSFAMNLVRQSLDGPTIPFDHEPAGHVIDGRDSCSYRRATHSSSIADDSRSPSTTTPASLPRLPIQSSRGGQPRTAVRSANGA